MCHRCLQMLVLERMLRCSLSFDVLALKGVHFYPSTVGRSVFILLAVLVHKLFQYSSRFDRQALSVYGSAPLAGGRVGPRSLCLFSLSVGRTTVLLYDCFSRYSIHTSSTILNLLSCGKDEAVAECSIEIQKLVESPDGSDQRDCSDPSDRLQYRTLPVTCRRSHVTRSLRAVCSGMAGFLRVAKVTDRLRAGLNKRQQRRRSCHRRWLRMSRSSTFNDLQNITVRPTPARSQTPSLCCEILNSNLVYVTHLSFAQVRSPPRLELPLNSGRHRVPVFLAHYSPLLAFTGIGQACRAAPHYPSDQTRTRS